MRVLISTVTVMFVTGAYAFAVNLSDCAGVIRVFGDSVSWMSSCFVVGDGSWAIASADAVIEKVGPDVEQPIRKPIFISFYTGQAWQCELRAYDKELEIALLKLPIAGLPAAPLASSTEFTKSKTPTATLGQIMSGEPLGGVWPTEVYGITREKRGSEYRLVVGQWNAKNAALSEIGKRNWLFLSDIYPDSPIPNGAMVARGSNVVGVYLNKLTIGSGKQSVSFGRCAISPQIARYLSERGIDTAALYDPPAPTIKREDGAGDAFQLRAAIYSQIGAGRPGEALERAQALVKLRPSEADAHLLLGVALTGSGKFEEAVKAFDEAAKIDPKLPTLRTSRALALIGLGKLSEAEADLLKAVEEAPDDVRPVTALADFYMGDEKTYDKAFTYANRAQSMAPNSPAAKLLLARVEKRRKNYQAALNSIQAVLKMAPKWPDAYYAAGTTFEESGDLVNAEKAYRKLVELQPQNTTSLITLASFLADRGKYDEAAGLISKIRELNPPQPILDALKELEKKVKGAKESAEP
ncbi:MAG: tetratricopeptide repeat protein [Armatimonadetes bacterium]|nr:tetratricopeptide repeat protein [Armatimonadota bacterium]